MNSCVVILVIASFSKPDRLLTTSVLKCSSLFMLEMKFALESLTSNCLQKTLGFFIFSPTRAAFA